MSLAELETLFASSEVSPTARASSTLFAEARLAELSDATDRGQFGSAADLRTCLAEMIWCADELERWAADAVDAVDARLASVAARHAEVATQLHRRLHPQCER